MDSHRRSEEIVIVGAGPTGLTLAIELARRSVPFRLIEKRAAPITTSNALAIQARTLEVFEHLGVRDPVLRGGHKLHALHIHAYDTVIAHIDLDGLETPYPFILVLPQAHTEGLLARRLEQLGGRIEREVELVRLVQTRDGVSASFQHGNGRHETRSAAWLIGCDGAHSAVRQELQAPFEGGDYAETFVLGDLSMAGPLPNDAAQLFFHPDGLLALVPMGGDHWRVIATVPADEDDSSPTLAELATLVTTRGPSGVRLGELTWASRPRIHHRKVQRFRHGRVFLAGDAAHIHSPAGGQGMNTGIQDAFNLAWKLALVVAGTAPASLLDSYDAEREPVARGVVRFTDVVTRIATMHRPLAQHVRNALLSLLFGVDGLAQRFAGRNAELTLEYAASPIVGERWSSLLPGFLHAGPSPGERAPDGELLNSTTGIPLRLFDLLRDPRHAVLLFTGEQMRPSDDEHVRTFAATVKTASPTLFTSHVITAAHRAYALQHWEGSLLMDPEWAVHRRYGATHACWYLIRPDGYVGFRGAPPRGEDWFAYVNRVFCGTHLDSTLLSKPKGDNS